MENFKIEIGEDGIKEVAVFDDGRKSDIRIDNAGHKFFSVLNRVTTETTRSARYFYGCIEDAVLSVKNGNGDVISASNTIGGNIDVLYFLDREYGNSLREKTLEGWKDAEFGYIVKIGNKNSFRGFAPITPKYEDTFYVGNNLSYALFNTKEEAQVFVDEIIDIAKGFVEETIQLNKNEAKENEQAIMSNARNVLDKIYDTFGPATIIKSLYFDIINEDLMDFRYENKKLHNYGYSICQAVKIKD